MQLSGLFNSGLPVKVVGTIIVGGVVYASVIYLHRRWRKKTQEIPQTTPAPVQMNTIENNVEEQTEKPVSENTTSDNNEESDTDDDTY